MLPERIRIDDKITYWKATEEPLSADVCVIEGDMYTWVYDVGCSDDAAMCIQSLRQPTKVILSHFHPDHTGNLCRITYDTLYQGAYTLRYTKQGEVVKGHLWIEDGVRLHLFELPCSHAKGSVGLEVNEKYAFLGDAIYCAVKDGRGVYNANLLAEEIKVLRELKAEYFLLSHDKRFVRKKEVVLVQLEGIYARRDRQSAYIEVSELPSILFQKYRWKRIHYKLFISRWGIPIILKAGYRICDNIECEERLIKIAERIYFSREQLPYPVSSTLIEQEISWISRGLRMVSEQLECQMHTNQYMIIAIQYIHYSPCDIQDEAFAAAMMQWCSEMFGFPVPEYKVYFDKDKGKYGNGEYVFEFPI